MTNGPTSVPRIDGFSDLRIVGRGGFSTVYAALQVDLHRWVALKVITNDEESAHRLEREVRALGALSDVPNIVTPHAVVITADGLPALVMPLFQESLADRIRRDGPQPIGDVQRWTRQVATCIDRSHRRRVFHRDLKPANVLLDDVGGAHVADFGIAALDSLAARTTTVLSISPPHAPPERLRGDESDPSSGDIYSLASTMYFSLAGREPFGTTSSGGAHGLLERIASAPVPSDASMATEVHAVLARSMAKDPQQRFRSATEFADALDWAVGAAENRTILRTHLAPADRADAPAIADAEPAGPYVSSQTHADPESFGSGGWSADAPVPGAVRPGAPEGPALDPSLALRTPEQSKPTTTGRRLTIGAAVAIAMLLLIGGCNAVARTVTGSFHPPLRLEILDQTTQQNPLPDSFKVFINGVQVPAEFDGTTAVVVSPDPFAKSDSARLTVTVPEHIVFALQRSGHTEGTERIEHVVITDNKVKLPASSRVAARANPAADAAEAARVQLAAERTRVRDLLGATFDQLAPASAAYDRIWEGRETAPYPEIAVTVNGEVIPILDAALVQLDAVMTDDPNAQQATAAMRACMQSTRDAYVREASYNPDLTNEQNEAEQSTAWEATAAPCDDALTRQAGLK